MRILNRNNASYVLRKGDFYRKKTWKQKTNESIKTLMAPYSYFENHKTMPALRFLPNLFTGQLVFFSSVEILVEAVTMKRY